jgi:tetrathionate reductase subunit A
MHDKKEFPSRRGVLKIASLAAGLTALGVRGVNAARDFLNPRKLQQTAPNQQDPNVRVLHSVCLGCNTRCGNRAVVRNGVLEKMSGNPYHPYNSLGTPVPYETPVKETLEQASPLCGKGQSAPNYVYNPYRILKPLKRTGERGSGKFEPIAWEQLIHELSQGGRLFESLGEDREVKGLKHLNSDDPMVAEASELGPERNRFVFMTGRLQTGRKELIDRFVKSSMGSINRIGHTDICGLGFRMGNWALTDQKQVELKADPWSAEYILIFGANVYEALQPGINVYAAALAKRHSKGEVKFTIVDPRAQHASCHAEDWIPIKPGQDGAFAMGMVRWIIENKRYNEGFLSAPNATAAKKNGYGCHSNATFLIIADPNDARYGEFLRVKDINEGAAKDAETCVAVSSASNKPEPANKIEVGVLEVDRIISVPGGKKIPVKSAFTMLQQSAQAHSLADYAEFAGVGSADIEKTAKDFTSHGTKAAVCQYHGAGNYAEGTYAAYAVAVLNALIGSVDRKGGYNKSGGAAASWKKGWYNLTGFKEKRKASGVPISREKRAYEETSEYRSRKASGTPYPPQRPWFPFSKGGLSTEAFSGMDERYPYGCGMLVTYFYNPVYSTPGGYRFVETLKDRSKIPLHVSVDVTVNESNIYADYIVPDVTYLEGHYGWLSPHAPSLRFTGIRTPIVEPLTGKTTDGRPFCLETFLIDLAIAADLPGFGDKAITGEDGQHHPLHRGEDFYLRGFANIARNANLPVASEGEVAWVEMNYPVAKFKDILPMDQWKQVCFLLARGGVFKPYEDVFDGENHKYGIKKVSIYNDKLARTVNSQTGTFFQGTPRYVPPKDSQGKVIADEDRDYPFTLVSHKMSLHTQSRTTCQKWVMEVFPTNFIFINRADAKQLGLASGDRVMLKSRSNPEGISGNVELTRLVREGCLAVSFHYGHTQMGARPLSIKNAENVFLGGNQVAKSDSMIADKALGTGLNPNMAARLDENLNNTPLVDLVGGFPDFSSTRVKIERV